MRCHEPKKKSAFCQTLSEKVTEHNFHRLYLTIPSIQRLNILK